LDIGEDRAVRIDHAVMLKAVLTCMLIAVAADCNRVL
jgi:hypothetical protein